jgi:hypothetical protein
MLATREPRDLSYANLRLMNGDFMSTILRRTACIRLCAGRRRCARRRRRSRHRSRRRSRRRCRWGCRWGHRWGFSCLNVNHKATLGSVRGACKDVEQMLGVRKHAKWDGLLKQVLKVVSYHVSSMKCICKRVYFSCKITLRDPLALEKLVGTYSTVA